MQIRAINNNFGLGYIDTNNRLRGKDCHDESSELGFRCLLGSTFALACLYRRFTDEFLIGALGRKGGTRSLPRSVLARVGIELLVPPTPSSLNIQASLLAMVLGQL
ncbi:transposase [Pseudomonas sp. A25(2017)]|nr:transposase [Pseudomonas sp. A25(2017)]